MIVSAFAIVASWQVWATWRATRLLRHAKELDALLAHVCVMAYVRRTEPIWQAWMAVYGDISIEVTQTRREE